MLTNRYENNVEGQRTDRGEDKASRGRQRDANESRGQSQMFDVRLDEQKSRLSILHSDMHRLLVPRGSGILQRAHIQNARLQALRHVPHTHAVRHLRHVGVSRDVFNLQM